jgi:gliding motility-associated-like protein
VHPLPIAGFKLFPETADIFTAEIEGTDLSVYGDSIVYFFSDGNQSISKNFAHKFIDSGHYEIKQWVSSQFGCLDSITKKLYISFAYNLFIPDAFTPTEDGLNEGFRPVGLGMVRYEMSIYNRWGEKVFESETDQPQWDGKDALPGYYLYHIRAFDFRNNVHSYSGAVYLIR